MGRALAPYNLTWLEEPVWPPEDYQGLARVAAALDTPIAAGEKEATALGFREMLRAFIRPHVEAGHSLWLDWDNVLSTAFGGRDGDSTVLVADRAGEVQLVVGGPPEGETFRTVSATLQRLE